jgi:hypothetical protein
MTIQTTQDTGRSVRLETMLAPTPVCKNCGKPIEYFTFISAPCLQWKHASGHYGCNESRPMHSVTYAEVSA